VSGTSRLDLTSRILCLSTVLGLVLAFGAGRALQGVLLLALVAASAGATERASWISYRWLGTVEGLTAGVVIGLVLPQGALLLPYLLIPPFIAGIGAAGRRTVALIVVVEAIGLLTVAGVGQSVAGVLATVELVSPWIAVSIGVGFVADWMLRIRGDSAPVGEQSYLAARRLLTQLRAVTRRLSSGLDPVSIGEQILLDVKALVLAQRSALFVRTEYGAWTPLVYQGADARMALVPEDDTFQRCVEHVHAVSAAQPSGRADCRHRFAFPVRIGTNLIGVVLADGPDPLGNDLDSLAPMLAEHALRLDAALVFDEVRALATVEERQRLAREIHDGLAQELASLGYLVDELADTATTEAQGRRLLYLRGEISRVVNELRLSIFDLRSEIDASGGLGSALSTYVRAVGARSGLTVHLKLDETPRRLRSDVEGELLRITQEAVTNARKHSRGENLWVDCCIKPPSAHISIQDDGGGLGAARPDSYGLKIMRERAERIGAHLDIHEETAVSGGLGTKVTVTLSYHPARPSSVPTPEVWS
jgi:signal transduction histidine kinase